MEQESILVERFERVVLMLDGDAAGRTASRMISAKVSERYPVVVVTVPDGAQARPTVARGHPVVAITTTWRGTRIVDIV